jgi:DNA repair protein RadC
MRYAYSIKTTRIKEKDFPYDGKKISCTSDLVAFAKDLADADIEKMLCVYLDAQNKIVCIKIDTGTGTIKQCAVYPREIIRHALLSNAKAIILVHNHPSGHPKPSEEDIRITRTIREAAKILEILVHDHLILCGDRFFSMREEGISY